MPVVLKRAFPYLKAGCWELGWKRHLGGNFGEKYVSVVGRVRLGMWEQIGCQNRYGLLSVGGQLDPLSSFA